MVDIYGLALDFNFWYHGLVILFLAIGLFSECSGTPNTLYVLFILFCRCYKFCSFFVWRIIHTILVAIREKQKKNNDIKLLQRGDDVDFKEPSCIVLLCFLFSGLDVSCFACSFSSDGKSSQDQARTILS